MVQKFWRDALRCRKVYVVHNSVVEPCLGRVVPTCWRDVLFRSEQTRWKKCWKRREVEGMLRTQVLEKTVVRMCGKSVVTRTRAVLKEAGEKAAKKQRKVESQEAKVARKKAKEQKAKKGAKAAKQRQRRKENKEAGCEVTTW